MQQNIENPFVGRLMVRPKELKAAFGIGDTQIAEDVRNGKLESHLVEKRLRLITVRSALERYMGPYAAQNISTAA